MAIRASRGAISVFGRISCNAMGQGYPYVDGSTPPKRTNFRRVRPEFAEGLSGRLPVLHSSSPTQAGASQDPSGGAALARPKRSRATSWGCPTRSGSPRGLRPPRRRW